MCEKDSSSSSSKNEDNIDRGKSFKCIKCTSNETVLINTSYENEFIYTALQNHITKNSSSLPNTEDLLCE